MYLFLNQKRGEYFITIFFIVVQKAFIEVNEEGTEAAAATADIMCDGPSDDPSFTCDRPFMFMITDDLTKVTLFSGHVIDPTSQ